MKNAMTELILLYSNNKLDLWNFQIPQFGSLECFFLFNNASAFWFINVTWFNMSKTTASCSFCNQSKLDRLSSKKFNTELIRVASSDSLWVHHCCAFWAPLTTRSKKGAISGVLPEINRARKLKCFICKKKGAANGCNTTHCRRSYHITCVLQTPSAGVQFAAEPPCIFCPRHLPDAPHIPTITPSKPSASSKFFRSASKSSPKSTSKKIKNYKHNITAIPTTPPFKPSKPISKSSSKPSKSSTKKNKNNGIERKVCHCLRGCVNKWCPCEAEGLTCSELCECINCQNEKSTVSPTKTTSASTRPGSVDRQQRFLLRDEKRRKKEKEEEKEQDSIKRGKRLSRREERKHVSARSRSQHQRVSPAKRLKTSSSSSSSSSVAAAPFSLRKSAKSPTLSTTTIPQSTSDANVDMGMNVDTSNNNNGHDYNLVSKSHSAHSASVQDKRDKRSDPTAFLTSDREIPLRFLRGYLDSKYFNQPSHHRQAEREESIPARSEKAGEARSCGPESLLPQITQSSHDPYETYFKLKLPVEVTVNSSSSLSSSSSSFSSSSSSSSSSSRQSREPNQRALEASVASITGVTKLSTLSSPGSTVTYRIDLDVDVNVAVADQSETETETETVEMEMKRHSPSPKTPTAAASRDSKDTTLPRSEIHIATDTSGNTLQNPSIKSRTPGMYIHDKT